MGHSDKTDVAALIGVVLASVDSVDYLPQDLTWMGTGGMGLALLAILSSLYVRNKTAIVGQIDSIRHRVFGSEHIAGDEEVIEDALDDIAHVVEEVTEDYLDDGIINDSN